MVRLALLSFFFVATLPALAQEPARQDVPTLAGTRSFQEYFRTECPEETEGECLKLWAAARVAQQSLSAREGGIPVAPQTLDGRGVPSVPQSSAAPVRGTIGVFIPPNDPDQLICERTGDCAAWHAKQAKNRAIEVRKGK